MRLYMPKIGFCKYDVKLKKLRIQPPWRKHEIIENVHRYVCFENCLSQSSTSLRKQVLVLPFCYLSQTRNILNFVKLLDICPSRCSEGYWSNYYCICFHQLVIWKSPFCCRSWPSAPLFKHPNCTPAALTPTSSAKTYPSSANTGPSLEHALCQQ